MTETPPSPKLQSFTRVPWLLVIVLAIFLTITVGLLVTTLNIRDQALSGQATALAQADAAANAQTQAETNAATAQAQMLRSESTRLGAQAFRLSSGNDSRNAQLAALLSIRALGLGYSADADLALSQSFALLNGTSASGNQLRVISDTGPLDHAVFSADGRQILARAGNVLKWWDVQTGTELRSLPIDGDIAMYSSDHKLVLITRHDSGGVTWTAHLIELEHGAELQHFTSPTKYLVNARLLTGGKYMITIGAESPDKLDPVMQLWNVQKGQEVKRFANSEFDAVLSPNGKYLITASKYGYEQLDATSLTEVRKLPSDVQDFTVFSPDSRYLLTGNEGQLVTLLNADTGHANGSFTDSKAPVDFSPDSNLLYVNGSLRLRIVDVKTEAEHGHLDDSAGIAAFSPDSTLLLAATTDNTAHVLNAQTGVELRALSGHTGPINNLAFSPDGQYLMTGSEDGTVRVWKVDYHLLIAQVCRMLSRDLTDSERRKYDIPDTGPTCPRVTATF